MISAATENLESILNELAICLQSDNTTTVSLWFQCLDNAVRKAGLLWAVAEQPSRDQLLGSPETVKLVESRLTLKGQNADVKSSTSFYLVETTSVIEVRLRNSSIHIWFGVGGLESVDPLSHWKTFIDHIAEIADAALVRITVDKEMENLRTQAAQLQGLATVAVTTGTLIHQLTNLVKDLSSGMSTLLEGSSSGRFKCDEVYHELIRAMSDSTDQLLELTGSIIRTTKLEPRRPCSLLEAVHHSARLFDLSLAQRDIKLNISIAPNLIVDAPFDVVSFALANLIDNAKDAIAMTRESGSIIIEAEESKDMVYCYLTDNGPGIPVEIKDRIFNLGATGKSNSGGWGLYLTAHSLKANRGNIELSESGPNGTRFTIGFPKVKQE